MAGYLIRFGAHISDREWEKILSVFSIAADMNSLMRKRTSGFYFKMAQLVPQAAKLRSAREVSFIFSVLMLNNAFEKRSVITSGVKDIVEIISAANRKVGYPEDSPQSLLREIKNIELYSMRWTAQSPQHPIEPLTFDISRVHYLWDDPVNLNAINAFDDYNSSVPEAETIPFTSFVRLRRAYIVRLLADYERASGPFVSGFFRSLNDNAARVLHLMKDNIENLLKACPMKDTIALPDSKIGQEEKKILDFASAK
jgi:hypothetical protein